MESPQFVAALVEAGADIEARDESGRTPLYSVAEYAEYAEMAAVLLSAGADLEARNHSGWTPLHVAADGGVPAVVVALLDAGADPKALDERAWTPWDGARTNRDLGGTQAYRRLRDAHTR